MMVPEVSQLVTTAANIAITSLGTRALNTREVHSLQLDSTAITKLQPSHPKQLPEHDDIGIVEAAVAITVKISKKAQVDQPSFPPF